MKWTENGLRRRSLGNWVFCSRWMYPVDRVAVGSTGYTKNGKRIVPVNFLEKPAGSVCSVDRALYRTTGDIKNSANIGLGYFFLGNSAEPVYAPVARIHCENRG